jgi:hypothetical protein
VDVCSGEHVRAHQAFGIGNVRNDGRNVRYLYYCLLKIKIAKVFELLARVSLFFHYVIQGEGNFCYILGPGFF